MRFSVLISGLTVFALVGVLFLPASGKGAPPSESGTAFAQQVSPLLKSHCLKCHSGAEPRGELSLQPLTKAGSFVTQRKTWLKVVRRLRAGDMPPEDAPQPQPDKLASAIESMEAALSNVDCTKLNDPGRVTIRRLNREEYKNTIRDLLGIDLKLAEDFPEDDIGYGFDNIGDVLSTSPLLLEKYVDAAEKIAEQVIFTPETIEGPKHTFAADQMQGGQLIPGGVRALNSVGRVFVEHEVPLAGRYLIRVKSFAQQAGPELAKIAMVVDRETFKIVEVDAEEDRPQDYVGQVILTSGKHSLGVQFLNDYYNPQAANADDRDRNLRVVSLELVGPIDEALQKAPAAHRRIVFQNPTPKTHDACVRDVVRRFASRAFRRPAKDIEVGRLAALATMAERSGDSFEAGIRLAVQATLVSPHFLFRGETDPQPDNPKESHPVSEYELASRLSYFLWSTMPDEKLFQQASKGTLRKNLDVEVRRMLSDPKSQALVENFGGQWLQTRRLVEATPDPDRFPGFNDALRAAMAKETELFFSEVMRKDLSVLEFLDGKFTFLNEPLARHYGMTDIQGDQFRRVKLDGKQRSGVLTHASVLTITSNPTRTSPVKRGKWILEQILGETPPPPPPDVPELEEGKAQEQAGTLRERLELHRSKAICASCHRQLDPLGFALENYDAVGAWRNKEGNHTIDASGELPDGTKFQGPAQMKSILKNRSDQIRRALAEKMLTYALGRGLEYYDECAVRQMVRELTESDDRFSSLILAVVRSTPFQMRRGDGDSP